MRELSEVVLSAGWRTGHVIRRRADGALQVTIEGDTRWLLPQVRTFIGVGQQVAILDDEDMFAYRSQRGQILPLATAHLFSLLAGGGRVALVGFDEAPSVDITPCRMCTKQGGTLCGEHKRLGPMGNVYRGSSYGRTRRSFESAAFRRDWKQAAHHLEEAAATAFIGEARDLLEVSMRLKSMVVDSADRAVFLWALLRLAERAEHGESVSDLLADLDVLSSEFGPAYEVIDMPHP